LQSIAVPLHIVLYLGLLSGQRQLMIGNPVAIARYVQRYKELLLESADAKAEAQIRLHQTDGRLLRAIEEALGRIRQGMSEVCHDCKRPVSKAPGSGDAPPSRVQGPRAFNRLMESSGTIAKV
jgi:hypothetical protein